MPSYLGKSNTAHFLWDLPCTYGNGFKISSDQRWQQTQSPRIDEFLLYQEISRPKEGVKEGHKPEAIDI